MYREQGIEIDVDGSWHESGRVGYGLVIRRDGREIYREGGSVPADDPDLTAHRQIGGEIYAVVQAIRWCAKNKISACVIYHDYEGLRRWALGEWKARTPLTKRYVSFLQRIPVQIEWVKVPAHAGLRWNEVAHQLANQT
ncbi:MAG: reverse transcriptase-like protein [Bacteroidia bacterium]|nr:reverse transcriptase-like protein [Bacteroidia bacterium]MCX7652066.1 reverse transcriptase-like protein [Bacteroidia bacterium]MDW8416948.1 RNase H family protein [Bacteroidia bacterium]